jgi:hypothetical protein
MKKSIFLYLFIFAVLFNIFTYMYFTNKQKHEEERIVNLEKRVNDLLEQNKGNAESTGTDSDANYFALETNDNAMEYFGDDADIAAIELKVKEGISELNTKPEGNPLTQQEPLNGVAFRINKVHLLNNRWIIADYSNGTAWGEVLIKYFINEDGTVDYESIQTLLYANTVK